MENQDSNFKPVYTVHWRAWVNGKVTRMAESFDTREERDAFMQDLPKTEGWIETYRWTDLEAWDF